MNRALPGVAHSEPGKRKLSSPILRPVLITRPRPKSCKASARLALTLMARQDLLAMILSGPDGVSIAYYRVFETQWAFV